MRTDLEEFCYLMLGAIIGLVLLVVLMALFTKPAHAASLKEQRHEHVLAYSDYIRGKVQAIALAVEEDVHEREMTVEVILFNGKVIKGTFNNYIPFDDNVWITSLENKNNFFKSEAFSINEIYDITVIATEPV